MLGYLALGLVAGLAAIERKGFLQAMLSRPIALAPIAGLAGGDAAAGLLVGPPLELLWLGAVNMGAVLPDHETIGAAAIAGGAAFAARALDGAGLSGPAALPAAAVLAFAVCAPLAILGRRAERYVERYNERLHARAERDLMAGDLAAAARVNLFGAVPPFLLGLVLAPLGAGITHVLALALGRAPALLVPLAAGWLAVAAFSGAAGARSLRAERAPVAYLAALGAGACLVVAAAWAGGRP